VELPFWSRVRFLWRHQQQRIDFRWRAGGRGCRKPRPLFWRHRQRPWCHHQRPEYRHRRCLHFQFFWRIANRGTIAGAGTGVAVIVSSLFTVGITNSGAIASGRPGIGVGLAFSPSHNKVSVLPVSTFTGSILNQGSISAGNSGIVVIASVLAGGITNTGTILSQSNSGIFVSASTFSGAINNSGTISARHTGLRLDHLLTFSGGIANNGMIAAGSTAVRVSGGYGVHRRDQ
jgi:hypothetical protein